MILFYLLLGLIGITLGFFAGYGIAAFLYNNSKLFRDWLNDLT